MIVQPVLSSHYAIPTPAEPTFKTPHEGMFKSHGGTDFIDQIKFMHDPGFRSIEDNDLYHMQRNEGNRINNMERCWGEIAYIQIGDNPGRKEPTTGEIDYKNVFKYIYDKGYRGIMGMEHGNAVAGKEGEKALIAAYRVVDSY